LNILFDSTKCVEFSFKTNINNILKIETTETQIPIVKTFTYLNDNYDVSSIITNVNNETYKYKNYTETNYINFSIHKKLNHISFDGGNIYHSENSQIDNDSLILILNLWNEPPINVKSNNLNNFLTISENIFDNKLNNIINIDKNNNTKIFEVDNILFKKTFEEIFYMKNYSIYSELNNLLSNEILLFDNFIFDFSKIIKNSENIVENAYKLKPIELFSKKFIQRFNYKNFYNTFSCNWLINEFNNHVKNNKETLKNDNIINVEKMPNVLNFILFSFQQIIKFICLSYNISEENKTFKITDIFILNNKSSNNVEMEKVDLSHDYTTDNSTISVKILLNNSFEEGNLYFDDDILYFLEKGEAIIHNGNQKYTYNPVKNGNQYILNGFINIYDN
jgi:hypothetical protein